MKAESGHRYSHLLEKGIRPIGIEDLVAGHTRHEVFSLGHVDDIVSPSRNHVHGLDLVARDLEFNGLAGVNVALLNQSMALHDDEQLPLAVVPVLALGDSGL